MASNAGNSRMQGPQVELQKLSRTILPCRSCERTSVPSIETRSKSGSRSADEVTGLFSGAGGVVAVGCEAACGCAQENKNNKHNKRRIETSMQGDTQSTGNLTASKDRAIPDQAQNARRQDPAGYQSSV